MKFTKNKIILILLITAAFLLGIRLTFFLKDGTSNLVEGILIDAIVIISIGIIVLTLLPMDKSIKSFLYQYRDIVILSIFIFYSEIIFIIDNRLETSSITIFAVIFIISIIDTIALIVPYKVKIGFMIYIYVTLPIYLIAQDIYLSIFRDFFSFKEIVSVKEGAEFASGVIHFHFIHGVIIVSAIVALVLAIMYKTDNQIKITKQSRKIFYVPLLFFVLVNMNAEYPVKSARLYLSDHYLYKSVYSNKKFVSRFGAINYSVRDLFDSVIPKRVSKKDIKDIDEYFKNNEKVHLDNEYTGIYKDKNLIFINSESFNGIAVNKDLTPNLVRLRDEGLDFTNHYVPVFPRTTCDTEIIYNTGLIPSVTDGATCYTFNGNSYTNSLAKLFENEGYQADAFHSNEKEFYTRFKVYDGLGYENFYGQNEIGLSNTDKRYDSVFMDKAKDLIIKEDGKFLSFITTLSGHSPYVHNDPLVENLAVEKHYDEVNAYYSNLGIVLPEEVKCYIAAQMELDGFVGNLFKDLEEKGLLDDTVIVISGDHFPYTIEKGTFESYTGFTQEYEKSKTPLYIWSSDKPSVKIDRLSSSFDILPTIANLFGLDVNYTDYFGYDVFDASHQSVVYFKDYSWYDGENYVLDGNLIVGNANKDYIQKMTQKVYEDFDISIKILRTDYFAKKR